MLNCLSIECKLLHSWYPGDSDGFQALDLCHYATEDEADGILELSRLEALLPTIKGAQPGHLHEAINS